MITVFIRTWREAAFNHRQLLGVNLPFNMKMHIPDIV
jgi:hypothetical protein